MTVLKLFSKKKEVQNINSQGDLSIDISGNGINVSAKIKSKNDPK